MKTNVSKYFMNGPFDVNGKHRHDIFAKSAARFQAAKNNTDELMPDENGDYPYWTWFLPNPLPAPKTRKIENNYPISRMFALARSSAITNRA